MTWNIQRELLRFGPGVTYPPVSLAEARRYCRQLARTHYENFTVVSMLLPAELVRHFQHVYAWCRFADDLADETGKAQRALTLLRWWRDETLQMYRGHARHPILVALYETVMRFQIPSKPFLDLIFAFEQDQLVKRYATFAQLLDYCKNSANPVGRLVLYLCQAHTPENAQLADHICTALQLANFWQDVLPDLRKGRIYLPEEDRRAFGVTEADIQSRLFTPAFARLMQFEVNRTRAMFQAGAPLIERVPPPLRVDIELFVQGGLAILKRIESAHYNVLAKRPTVSKLYKGWLFLRALLRHWQVEVLERERRDA
jgi:squalene synthase HpnC